MPIFSLKFLSFLKYVVLVFYSYKTTHHTLGGIKESIYYLTDSVVRARFKGCDQGVGQAPFLSRATCPFPSSSDCRQNSAPSGSKTEVPFSCWLSPRDALSS